MSKKQISSDFFVKITKVRSLERKHIFDYVGIFIVELNELYHFKSNEQD